jgi:hypothetical protein
MSGELEYWNDGMLTKLSEIRHFATFPVIQIPTIAGAKGGTYTGITGLAGHADRTAQDKFDSLGCGRIGQCGPCCVALTGPNLTSGPTSGRTPSIDGDLLENSSPNLVVLSPAGGDVWRVIRRRPTVAIQHRYG